MNEKYYEMAKEKIEMAKEKIRNENEGKTLNDAFCGEEIALCLQAISAEDE